MASQRCLYEVLGVETTASIDEIRFAYRKLALKWHPDKIQQSGASTDVYEEATTRFQEIGRAYEVLADPTERAWYDSHRSQILSSAASPSGASTDFDFNLWPYFSPTVFSGYGDTGQGFYAVYRDVFQKLHQQEKSFALAHGVRALVDPPDMGGIGTSYLQVSKFYTHWLGFNTVKDFSWCDEYKITLAPNRKTRRFLEEENKKIRSKARKEFNDVVRRLAAFVKKRDKRVLERQREVQRLEKEREHILKVRREKMELEKIMKAKEYKEAEWTRVSILDLDRDDDGESDVDDSIGSYDWGRGAAKSGSRRESQEEYYCIVCSKKFRSNEQWRNHERSKKHIDRAASLKQSFIEEDDGLVETSSLSTRPQEENDEFLAGLISENNGVRNSSVSSDLIEMPDIVGLNIEETPVSRTSSTIIVSKDNTFGTDNRDIPCAIESASGDADFEDDEASSLLVMLNSYTKRQLKDSNHIRQRFGSAEDDSQKPAKHGMAGEILAMSDPDANRQKGTYDNQELDVIGKVSSSVGEDSIDVNAEDNEEIGYQKSKRKSRIKMRLERKQAASLGRHARLAEVLSDQKQVDRTVFNYEALVITEDADFLKERLQDESSLLDQTVSGDNTALEGFLDGSSEKSSGQAVRNKQRLMSKGNIDVSRAAVLKDQEWLISKAKMNKGGSKNLRNTCETCGKDFESRNQLFKHIEAVNHSVLKGK